MKKGERPKFPALSRKEPLSKFRLGFYAETPNYWKRAVARTKVLPEAFDPDQSRRLNGRMLEAIPEVEAAACFDAAFQKAMEDDPKGRQKIARGRALAAMAEVYGKSTRTIRRAAGKGNAPITPGEAVAFVKAHREWEAKVITMSAIGGDVFERYRRFRRRGSKKPSDEELLRELAPATIMRLWRWYFAAVETMGELVADTREYRQGMSKYAGELESLNEALEKALNKANQKIASMSAAGGDPYHQTRR